MENEIAMPMAKSLQQVVGALLFGSPRPLTAEEIRACLKSVAADDPTQDETVKLFAKLPLRDIKEALGNLKKELARLDLGFELVETPDGFRFRTQSAGGRWVRRLLKMDRPYRLSRPALETLAIIAYRQPISKSEVEAIRGVDAGHIVKSLMELHLVRIVGRSELPGRPFLYGTTPAFLDHFGLSTIKELNDLDPSLRRGGEADKKLGRKKSAPIPLELDLTAKEDESEPVVEQGEKN